MLFVFSYVSLHVTEPFFYCLAYFIINILIVNMCEILNKTFFHLKIVSGFLFLVMMVNFLFLSMNILVMRITKCIFINILVMRITKYILMNILVG